MDEDSHNSDGGRDPVLDVSVIIPHYIGSQVVECLDAVYSCPDLPREVILVDDASPMDTARQASERFQDVRLIRNTENLGFVGACNHGLSLVTSKYAVLLNDDAVVEAGWLKVMVMALEADGSLGAVQPKIVRVTDPSQFDYAGAAGGLIDRYGYPFALGRWFNKCETDHGQYDTPQRIFWASGTAMCMRMSVCRMIGTLETAFQMHMEEIDWCWRCQLAGFDVASVPAARVRHSRSSSMTPGQSAR